MANGINNEVGASLFGKGVAISAGYPISGVGRNTPAGRIYGQAFGNILFSNNFNTRDYQDVINNFKQGSVGNFEGNGIYNKFGVNDKLRNPAIKRFIPLIR